MLRAQSPPGQAQQTHPVKRGKEGGRKRGSEVRQAVSKQEGGEGGKGRKKKIAYLIIPMAASDATKYLGRKLVGCDGRLLDL